MKLKVPADTRRQHYVVTGTSMTETHKEKLNAIKEYYGISRSKVLQLAIDEIYKGLPPRARTVKEAQ